MLTSFAGRRKRTGVAGDLPGDGGKYSLPRAMHAEMDRAEETCGP